jgi:hypothetical protein
MWLRRWSVLLGLLGLLVVAIVAALGLWVYHVEYALAEMRSGGAVAASAAPWLVWIEILLFFAFSGAFGGILNLLLPYAATRGGDLIESPGPQRPPNQRVDATPNLAPNRPPTAWEFLVCTLGGMGGAIAGLGVMLLDN